MGVSRRSPSQEVEGAQAMSLPVQTRSPPLPLLQCFITRR